MQQILKPLKLRELKINQLLNTPIGQGVYQGVFHLYNDKDEFVGERALVRLPVDPETSKHLKDSNCIARGLWIFQESEIQ